MGHPGGGVPENKELAGRERERERNTNWYAYSEQKESHCRGPDGSCGYLTFN